MSLRNILKVKLKALLEKLVGEQPIFLLLGMVISIPLNYCTPLFPSVIFLLISLITFIVAAFILALSRTFTKLKLLFLGASIISVLFAFRAFFFLIIKNTVYNNLFC